MSYQVIIPAAGSGKRMGAGFNKLRLELAGSPIILHTLHVFISDPECSKIILVIDSSDQQFFEELLTRNLTKVELVNGGSERQYSVYNGLQVADQNGIILVHDGEIGRASCRERVKIWEIKLY